MSLPLVEKPSGSKTGQPMLNSFLILSSVFVAVLTGDRKSAMGKAQSSMSPSLALTRVTSLRLITHLYSEHLLDQDHYIDWLIASFRDSDLDALPIWLLIIEIHQLDVLQHRQRGRRLTEALLKQVDKVSSRCGSHGNAAGLNNSQASLPVNQEAYDAVFKQLVKLLKNLLLSAPSCFILPACWSKYEDVIKSCLDEKESYLRSSFDSLSKRNWRLRNRSFNQSSKATKSHRQTVIVYLDSLCDDPNFGRIASACLRVTNDYDLLVRTCIEWSSSLYRHGRFRTYAAARLLRMWKRKGVDLQGPIFNFLAESLDLGGLQKRDIYRLLAELVRSQHLCVGKYLQWLIARGTLDGHHEADFVSTILSMKPFNELIVPGSSMRRLLAI